MLGCWFGVCSGGEARGLVCVGGAVGGVGEFGQGVGAGVHRV